MISKIVRKEKLKGYYTQKTKAQRLSHTKNKSSEWLSHTRTKAQRLSKNKSSECTQSQSECGIRNQNVKSGIRNLNKCYHNHNQGVTLGITHIIKM